MRVNLLRCSKHGNLLPVDIKSDGNFTLRQPADVIQPVDEILWVENGNAAFNQVGDVSTM